MAISDLYKQGAKAARATKTGLQQARASEAGVQQTQQLTPDVTQQQQQQDEEDPSVIKDVALAPFRGVLDAATGIVDLADAIAPGDWIDDEFSLNFLGESQTAAGGFVSGVSQFLTGFFPGLGIASKAGKATKLSKLAKEGSKLEKAGKYVVKPMAAGAIADFSVFDGQEARLSDLIEKYPNLSNPITQYLKYEGNDDKEIEGRLKNVYEGLILEGIVGGTLVAFVKSLKAMRSYRKGVDSGLSKNDAAAKGSQEFYKEDPTVENIAKPDKENILNLKDTEDGIITLEELQYEAVGIGVRLKDGNGKVKDIETLSSEVTEAKAILKEKGIPRIGLEGLADAVSNLEKKFNLDEVEFIPVQSGKNYFLQYKRTDKPGEIFNLISIDGPNGKANQTDFIKRVKEIDTSLKKQKKGKVYNPEVLKKFESNYGEADEVVTFELKPGRKISELKEDVQRRFNEIKGENKTGGTAAVVSGVLREVGSSSEIEQLIGTTARELSSAGKLDEISDDAFRELDFAAEGQGPKTKVSLQAIKDGQDVELHKKWLEQNAASFMVLRQAGEQAVANARAYLDDIDNPEALREFVDSLAVYGEANRVNAIRARRDSMALHQRKYFKNSTGDYKDVEINPIKSDTTTTEDYTKFLQERLGSKSPQKLAQELAVIDNIDDLIHKLNATKKIAEKTAGRKMLEITQEYWINSILSGPATQFVNMIGNGLTNLMLFAEKSVGAILSGNSDLRKALFSYGYNMETLKESFDAAVLAAKTDDSILVRGSKQFNDTSSEADRAITAKNLNVSDKSALGMSVNFLGKLTRFPSRLLTTGDEFFKNLAYRQYLRTELATDAIRKMRMGEDLGENISSITEYVEKNLKNYINEGGHYYSQKGKLIEAKRAAEKAGKTFGKGQEEFIAKYLQKEPFSATSSRSILAEKAVNHAKNATFTDELPKDGIFNAFGNILTKHPILKFVVPFLRTPANILKFGLQRSPVGLSMEVTKRLSKEYRLKLKNGTPTEIAEVRGRLATGSLTTAATLYYVMGGDSFGFNITGSGPQNRKERDALRATGWQPYSIRTPGGTYLSYQRLDPVATMMQMAADYRDYLIYETPEDDDRNAAELFANMSMVYAVGLSDKTFLKGVNNMLNIFRDPEYYVPKLGKDISGGFVPNVLNQSKNYQSEIMVREAKGFSDTLLKRIPGKEEEVAPKRTILGEEVYRQNLPGPFRFLGVINPIYFSKEKNNIVDTEIAATGHGYSMPSKYLYGIKDIDLSQIKSNEGNYDAYDRLLELSSTVKINGKTLRSKLSQIMGKESYKKLKNIDLYQSTGEKSPKIDIINSIINAYRNKAKAQLFKENPEILEQYKQALKLRREVLAPSS